MNEQRSSDLHSHETMAHAQGRMEAEICALQSDMTQVKNDVRAIRDTLAEAKGGWKTLALVAGAAGAMGALAAKIAPFLPFR